MLGIHSKHKKILVAMSGGVDSSVVAILLHRMGYEVVGVTLQLAAPSCGLGACCTGRDLEDVKIMCKQEGFPHHLVLKREEFKEKVINYTVDAYGQGLTPSPCVWCNSKVRFDSLFNSMKEYGCDAFVTGHYAHVLYSTNDITSTNDKTDYQITSQSNKLLAGIDPQKDQSYFLSMLSKDLLNYIQFPLGNMHKYTVRKIARKLGIKVAEKKDSQDLCFVKDTYSQTLWNLKPDIFKPGYIKDFQGNILGEHDGIAQYTVGQRKGLGNIRNNTILKKHSTDPLYVIDVSADKNEIIVGNPNQNAAKYIHLTQHNLLADYKEGMWVEAKIRARSNKYLARLWNQGTLLEFMTPIESVARGQICVMYNQRQVIGAGLINNYTKAEKALIT